MIVRDGNHEIYVEVKQVTEDESVIRMRKELDKFLPALTRPVRVDIDLKSEMVISVTTRKPRERKEKLAEECSKSFRQQIAIKS